MDLIHKEVAKKTPKLSTLKQLMDATFKRRRDWIRGCGPSANEVLDKYPCLQRGKMVSVYISLLTHMHLDFYK